MKQLLKVVSYLGLALTLVPSFLVFTGALDVPTYKVLMLVGTACWIVTAPFWINAKGSPEPPTA